jgi:hypothetical protein
MLCFSGRLPLATFSEMGTAISRTKNRMEKTHVFMDRFTPFILVPGHGIFWRDFYKDIQPLTDKVDNACTRNYNPHNDLNAHKKDTLLWQKAF